MRRMAIIFALCLSSVTAVTTATAQAAVLFGDQAVEPTADLNPAGVAQAWPISNPTTGTATSISIYVDSPNTAKTAIVGLYSNSNNNPGSLIASGTVNALTAGAWNTATIPSTSVTSGQTYWISLLGQNGNLYFRDRANAACDSQGSSQNNLTSLPSSWSVGPTWGSCPVSAYINGTASGSSDPSGQPMPVGNVPGWNQVFADNFANENVPVGSFSGCSWPNGSKITQLNCTGLANYPSIEAKWFAYPDGWSGTPTTGTYEPSQVIGIQNGIMSYYIHSVNGVHMIAAAVPKLPGGTGSAGGMTYGRYIVRMRMDALPGYHASFLLWPDSNTWPRDGEIDWPEGDFNTSTISAFMHWQGGTTGGNQDAFSVPANFTQWHTYELDWTPTSCSFYMDGTLVGNDTNASLIPDTPMHWVLQTGTSFSQATPSNSTAGNVQIDWVAAYTRASS